MNRKKNIVLAKFLIIILCLVLITIIIEKVIARFETISNSTANIQTAFYVLGEDYQTMTLYLDAFEPRRDEYSYIFSVSNFKDGHLLEVDLEYDIIVTTTTNLPLEISLSQYIEPKKGVTEQNLIRNSETIIDEYGTYFRRLTMDTEILTRFSEITNTYILTISFPREYKVNDEYSDIIEGIEIAIDSRQTGL